MPDTAEEPYVQRCVGRPLVVRLQSTKTQISLQSTPRNAYTQRYSIASHGGLLRKSKEGSQTFKSV